MVGIQPAPQDGLSDEQLERRVNRLWNIDVEEESSEEMGPLERDTEFLALNGNRKLQKQYKLLAAMKIEEQSQEISKDDLTGQLLDPAMVKAARRVEPEYSEAKGVWEQRKREECLRNTCKNPIPVRWVDINKGDDATPNYRSRLVARDIRKTGEDPIFAPTPPLESLGTVLSLAATNLKGEKLHDREPDSPSRTQISFVDIARAYFCASTDPNDPTYVELPSEDGGRERGLCGLLLKLMYGTKKAADGWHCEYSGAP
jgi:hypothetical protein